MLEYYNFYGKAILVCLYFNKKSDIDDCMQEFKSLVISSGIEILHIITGRRVSPHTKFFVGRGKALEIANMVKNKQASIVVFNHILSPNQEKHLESLFSCRVVDRTELILNIFAKRAYTYEGKLQVELAKLRHFSTRLVHIWTHLKRQKGGVRLRGPGETQLEADRRLLRTKINRVILRLKKVEKQRDHSRQVRFRSSVPVVLLIGYTNVGKSSLFQLLTKSRVYIADNFFATLDPIFRTIFISGIGKIILVDTVGFIRDLPIDLLSAFRITLQEILHATMLLHVVDASNIKFSEQIAVVMDFLNKIKFGNIPILTVMNKIDKLKNFFPRVDYDYDGYPFRIWLSAKNSLNKTLFVKTLRDCLIISDNRVS